MVPMDGSLKVFVLVFRTMDFFFADSGSSGSRPIT